MKLNTMETLAHRRNTATKKLSGRVRSSVGRGSRVMFSPDADGSALSVGTVREVYPTMLGDRRRDIVFITPDVPDMCPGGEVVRTISQVRTYGACH